MKLEDFIAEYIEDVRRDAIFQNDTPHNVFLEKMSEQLQSMDYIFNPTIMPFYKVGSRQRIMQFDLYGYDDIDKSLVLLINDFNDDDALTTLNQVDIEKMANRMINYIDETYNGSIYKYIDPSQEAYSISLELQKRLQKDYVDVNNNDGIEKIKLFIVTNRKIKNVKNTNLPDFYGKRVDLNVWDIERIYDVINSGRDKEPILIDIEHYNNGVGLDFLKADFGHFEDYDAYLSIIPGKLLSDIYWEYGSRLLEGNVRAFLSVKGKVNKAIRKTIKDEPGKFFTYNNGIACTAKKIILSKDNKKITNIEDLQIINGGQTTASLTTAWSKDKVSLDNIFVPMKITVIKSDEYDEMIQNISKFANSQNKVTDADLFSNHPFHRKIESLSLKVAAPPKAGVIHNTFWYYERSRGKYIQSRFKFNTDAKLKEFERRYPKNQVITKEDLAKYLMSGIYLRPDWVSKGRAKNMTEFAQRIDKQWVADNTLFNEKYFRDAICYTIIFTKLDHMIANSDWYLKGGVKLNIIPYTISKMISNLPSGSMLDLNRIWKEQDIYPSLAYELNRIAQMADKFINDSKGVIPTEHAKKEETWKNFKNLEYTFSREFLNDTVSINLNDAEMNQAKKSVKQDEKINIEIQIYKLAQTENKNYWNRLLDEGNKRGLITPSENSIITNYICELAKAQPKKIPSESQYKIAWAVRNRLEQNGVMV